ncbi:hypothetical protein WJX72_010837 [[Myrmecia] bisecta]|uniref:SSD domain-containing protein n=1 Tax=[Myrmecia] bisecta TaxID=41462 RepID=A0AAW1PEQ2_9CHLO
MEDVKKKGLRFQNATISAPDVEASPSRRAPHAGPLSRSLTHRDTELSAKWEKGWSPSALLTRYGRWCCENPWMVLTVEIIGILLIILVVFATHSFKLSGSQDGREWYITGKTMVEEMLILHPMFEKYCQLGYNSTGPTGCGKPYSAISTFFPSSTYRYGSTMLPNIRTVLYYGASSLDNIGAFFSRDFTLTHLQSQYARSTIHLGLPLEGYLSSTDRVGSQQNEVYTNLLKPVDQQLRDLVGLRHPKSLDSTYMSPAHRIGNNSDVAVLWSSPVLLGEEYSADFASDALYAVIAGASVWVFIACGTKSLMIASVGICMMVLAMPLAFFFYRIIFQITFFSSVQLVTVFLIFGIGSDYLFIFFDAYKQSLLEPMVCGSLSTRMDYCCKRATKAVFATSFTTFVAFLATATSEILPIKAFGLYAAFATLSLFATNLLLLPPALVLWSTYFEDLPCMAFHPLCLSPVRRGEIKEDRLRVKLSTTAMVAGASLEDVQQAMTQPLEDGPLGSPQPPQDAAYGAGGSGAANGAGGSGGILGSAASNAGLLSQDLNAPVVAAAKRASIVTGQQGGVEARQSIVNLSVLAPTGRRASQLGPGKSTQQVVGEDGVVKTVAGPRKSARASLFQAFATAKNVVSGGELRRLGIPDLRPMEKFFGDTWFRVLARAKWAIVIVFLIAWAIGLGFALQMQPMQAVQQWLPPQHLLQRFADTTAVGGPFPDGNDVSKVHLVWGLQGMDTHHRQTWNADDRGTLQFDPTFSPASEQAQLHLLSANSSTLPLPPRAFFGKLLEFASLVETQTKYPGQIGILHDTVLGTLKLRYIQFVLDATFVQPMPAKDVGAVIAEWEAFAVEINSNAPSGVQHMYQISTDTWAFYDTQQALIRNAVDGLIIVLVLAFVVINILTGNLIVACLATFSITGIVVTSLGIGVKLIMGWEFGVAESIATTMLVGCCMDYSLYLAEAYVQSHSDKRSERVQDTLTAMGISINAGCLAKFLAGLHLFFCMMLLFRKFAFLICFTVFCSYCWSLCFFPALMLILGPEGDAGSWASIYYAAKNSSLGVWLLQSAIAIRIDDWRVEKTLPSVEAPLVRGGSVIGNPLYTFENKPDTIAALKAGPSSSKHPEAPSAPSMFEEDDE